MSKLLWHNMDLWTCRPLLYHVTVMHWDVSYLQTITHPRHLESFSHESFFSSASSKKNESRWESCSSHLHRLYSILMEIHLPPRLHTASILSLVCLRSFLPLLQSVFVIFYIFFSFYCSFSFCPLALSFVNFGLPW